MKTVGFDNTSSERSRVAQAAWQRSRPAGLKSRGSKTANNEKWRAHALHFSLFAIVKLLPKVTP